jgi:hypothetical protein
LQEFQPRLKLAVILELEVGTKLSSVLFNVPVMNREEMVDQRPSCFEGSAVNAFDGATTEWKFQWGKYTKRLSRCLCISIAVAPESRDYNPPIVSAAVCILFEWWEGDL